MVEDKQFWVVLTEVGYCPPNVGEPVVYFEGRNLALSYAERLAREQGGRYFLAHAKEVVERIPETVVRSLKK